MKRFSVDAERLIARLKLGSKPEHPDQFEEIGCSEAKRKVMNGSLMKWSRTESGLDSMKAKKLLTCLWL